MSEYVTTLHEYFDHAGTVPGREPAFIVRSRVGQQRSLH